MSSSASSSLRKKQLDAAAEAENRINYHGAWDEQMTQHQQQILITEATRQSSVVGAAGRCSTNRQNSNIHDIFSPSFNCLTSSQVTAGSRVIQEPCPRQSTQQLAEPSQAWAPQYALPQNIPARPLGDITFRDR